MIDRATGGILGGSSRGALDRELAARERQIAPIRKAIADTPITALPGRPELMQQAVEGGRAAFRVHCVQRSEEHTSELQSLMRISYAVFCLKKKTITDDTTRLNAMYNKSTSLRSSD